MAEKQILTKESLAKYQAELDNLTNVVRKEITARVKTAREMGDLSENAEYDAARDEQAKVEGRIEELRQIIASAEVVDESTIDYTIVHLGCKVTIVDKITKRETTFHIVDKSEVDSLNGKISYESPVGAALIGKKTGDEVEIQTPATVLNYKIKKIIKAE